MINDFKITTNFFFLIILSASILTFITSLTGINVKYFDDAGIVILFLYVLINNQNLNLEFTKWPIIFLFICFFSLILNFEHTNIKIFLIQIKNYLLPYLIFYIGCSLYNPTKFKNFINYFLIFSLILSIIGILEFLLSKHFYLVYGVFGNPLGINPFRSYSLIGNPVDFGFFLIFPLIVSYISKKNKIFSILFLASIFFTKSIGCFLTIFILLITSLYFKILSKKNITFFLILGLILISTDNNFQSRILLKKDNTKNSSYLDEASRYDYYLQTSKVVKDNIFLGVGAGNYGGWVSDKKNYFYNLYNIDMKGLNSIDIFYPHLIAETGLFGFFAFIMIYLSIIQKNFFYMSYYKKQNDTFGYSISVSVFLYGIALLSSGFWSMFLETSFTTILFFFISAFSSSYFNLKYKNDETV